MNFTEDHPWVTGFLSVEVGLVVVAAVLYLITPPTPSSNPLDWHALKIVGLLLGAFAVILGGFGLTVGVGVASSRLL